MQILTIGVSRYRLAFIIIKITVVCTFLILATRAYCKKEKKCSLTSIILICYILMVSTMQSYSQPPMLILFFSLPSASYFADHGPDKKADSSVLCLNPPSKLLQLPWLQPNSSLASRNVRSSAAPAYENLLCCHAFPVLQRCSVGLCASFLAYLHRREILPSRAKLCWHAVRRKLYLPLCHQLQKRKSSGKIDRGIN